MALTVIVWDIIVITLDSYMDIVIAWDTYISDIYYYINSLGWLYGDGGWSTQVRGAIPACSFVWHLYPNPTFEMCTKLL